MSRNTANKESTKRASIREQNRKKQQRERVILISGVSIFAIIIAVLLIIPNLPQAVGELVKPDTYQRSLVNANAVGDPNAPIKVIEYSDFKCVHCMNFWESSEKRLLTEYVETGKVYYQYISFSFLSPESYTSAEAAYCAMDQGKFWEYHDYLFANYGTALTDGVLKKIAQQLGLNMNDFNACYNSNKYQVKVQEDFSAGQSLGVNSTPTFIVNGKNVFSNELFGAIDEALAAQP